MKMKMLHFQKPAVSILMVQGFHLPQNPNNISAQIAVARATAPHQRLYSLFFTPTYR
jgi:hypothetical protein